MITSSDLILIDRDDRVDYATPSAVSVLGYDPLGRNFGELVSRSPPPGDPAVDTTSAWSDVEEGAEGHLRRADGRVLTVLVRRRDLTNDPTVSGIVTTIRDVTAEREAQKVLAYKATHDTLTQLVNAEHFEDDLQAGTNDALAEGSSSAVLIVDLDNFKGINATHGREVADEILVSTASRIRSSLRQSDIAARLGSDQFGILLRRVDDIEDVRHLTQHVADVLARPTAVDSGSVECHASIGVAMARSCEEHQALLRRARTMPSMLRRPVARAHGASMTRECPTGAAARSMAVAPSRPLSATVL